MRPSRRTLVLGLTASAVAASVAWLTATIALPAIARGPVASQLAALGFEGAQFRVERVGSHAIRLADLRVSPDLAIDRIDLEMGEGGLASGRVTSVTLTGARWETSLDAEALRASAIGRLVRAAEAGDGPPGGAPAVHLARSQITIARSDGRPLTIDLDGDVLPGESRAALTLRSELGEHTLTARHHDDTETTRIDLALRSRDGDALRASLVRAHEEHAPIAFRVAAHVATDHLAPALPELPIEGHARLDAAGTLRPDAADAWALERVAVTAKLDGLRVAAAHLHVEHVAAALHVEGVITASGDVTLELGDRSRLRARRVQLSEWRAERIELAPTVRVERTPGAFRVLERDPIAARLDVLAVGTGDEELRAERAELTITSRDTRALLERDGRRLRSALHVEGHAPRMAGVLRGRGLRARGDVDAAQGEGVRAPVRLEIARVREPQSELSLERARVDLVIAPHGNGDVRADGRVRARAMSWRHHALGATHGALTIAAERVALDWRAPALRLVASIGLEHGDGRARVDVPETTLRAEDGLHRALLEVTGMAVTGRAAGRLDVDVRSPARSRAQLRLEGATVTHVAERSRATGVHGTIELARLEPVTSAGADHVRWSALTLGDLGTVGAGSARVRFERAGTIGVEDAVAALGGGRVAVAPIRFDPDAPDVTLDLSFDGVDVQRVLALITRGRATGTGRLDGRVGIRVVLGDEPRLVLGRGRLAARGNGRIVIPGGDEATAPLELDRLRSGEWLEDRVLTALRSFEYTRLVLDLVGEEGRKRVVARVSGRGTRIPQEIDLRVSVRGIQPAIDQALRLSSSVYNQ